MAAVVILLEIPAEPDPPAPQPVPVAVSDLSDLTVDFVPSEPV
jgi:hypothetical protein